MRLVNAILFFASFMASACFADGLSVVDVRKNIPLADDETAYKDFYLAGGDLAGLKKNLVVTAVRKIAVRDSKGSQSFGEIEIPVGQLRVLAVYGSVAVAREYKLLSRDDNPMLEQVGVMSGDVIDLAGSFVDAKPLAKPKKVSEVAPVVSEGRATASIVTTVVPTPASIPAPAVASPAPAATTVTAPPGASAVSGFEQKNAVSPGLPEGATTGLPTELLKPAVSTPAEPLTAKADTVPVQK